MVMLFGDGLLVYINDKNSCQKLLTTILVIWYKIIVHDDKESCQNEMKSCHG